MKRFRATFAVLICASLMALTGCGGKDPANTAASASPTTGTPSSDAAADSSAPPSPAAAETTGGMSDKELCESAKKAGDDMKAALIAIMKSGKEPSPADYKKILTDVVEKLNTLTSGGGDSKVAASISKLGAEAAKVAAAADPENAADNPAFEKAGAELTAACKAVGVNANF